VRALLDVYMLMSCAINGVVLAIAAASYGPLRLLRWMPHLPFELAGLAFALAVYVAARRRPLTIAQLACAGLPVAALMAVAAVLETCSQPHA
jgi:hypothetical protein